MSKQDQQKINSLAGGKPISFSPQLAVLLESIEAAILTDYLLYLQGSGRKSGWVYKTVPEMQIETGLTRTKQETAIKKCQQLGVLTVALQGIPATRHFNVNVEKLELLIPSLRESCKLGGLSPPNKMDRTPASTTKSYPERTAKNAGLKDLGDKRKKLYDRLSMQT